MQLICQKCIRIIAHLNKPKVGFQTPLTYCVKWKIHYCTQYEKWLKATFGTFILASILLMLNSL